MAGGVVRDHVMRDGLLSEFPCSQGGALATGACLIAEDVEAFAFGLRGVNGRGGAADVDEGEPAGVAMGEDFHPATNESRAVPADFAAMLYILVCECLGGIERELLPVFDGLASGHFAEHSKHGIDRING